MTIPCPHCWGQRLILEQAKNGEGLVPVKCEHCIGTGFEVLMPDFTSAVI